MLREINSLTGGAERIFSREANNGTSDGRAEEFLAYALSKGDREKILSNLYSALGISREKVSSENHLFLSWPQIKQMFQDEIDFGNHGQSHSPFSTLSKKEQEKEIINSKRTISENLGTDFIPFAYPFGKSRDFTPETKEIVKRNGHSCIVTTRHTLNLFGTSRYELGRIHIGEIPVYRMAFELEKSLFKNFLRKIRLWKGSLE